MMGYNLKEIQTKVENALNYKYEGFNIFSVTAYNIPEMETGESFSVQFLVYYKRYGKELVIGHCTQFSKCDKYKFSIELANTINDLYKQIEEYKYFSE